jgi:hypothetical protein
LISRLSFKDIYQVLKAKGMKESNVFKDIDSNSHT